jgi:hypothetical protein
MLGAQERSQAAGERVGSVRCAMEGGRADEGIEMAGREVFVVQPRPSTLGWPPKTV